MTVTIRESTADDASTIHRFILKLAEYEREPEAVLVTPDVLRLQMLSAKPPFECLIADDEAAPVGFALFFFNYSTWLGKPGLYIEDIFVELSHRERGIGKMFLSMLAEIAMVRGCGRMEWSVLDWNEPSIEFYKQAGAIPLGDWTTYRLDSDGIAYLAKSKRNKV